jgi:hypothetical protein
MTDPARSICQARCAKDGDPPCYELDGEPWTLCDDCKRDCGEEVLERLDPGAVVKALL